MGWRGVDPRQANFVVLYEQHVWSVYGFLAYRLRDRETAEDLTQTTFERALRNWSRFDPRRGSERTWLLAIARNLLIDQHRRSRVARLEPLDESVHPAVAGPEAREPGSPELLEALAQLSDRDREIIALRFGADLTGPEIAAVVDLSLANVQQILSRSLRRLRALVQSDPARVSGEPVSPRGYSAPRPSSAPTTISSSPPPP